MTGGSNGKCSNSNASLKAFYYIQVFRYWVYNGARVEIVILEENAKDPKKQLKIAWEKPYIDCGTVTMNTVGRIYFFRSLFL